MTEAQQYIDAARRTVEVEARAVHSLIEKSGRRLRHRLPALILACEGRVVVTGMGKSGHICNKIAATLASTGTPAFFGSPR